MGTNLSTVSLLQQVKHQISYIYPYYDVNIIPESIGLAAFDKTVSCVNSIKDWSSASFNSIISWQYSTYLYFLSRELFLSKEFSEYAELVFLLNKALNSIELYYKVDLKNYFFLSHTTGLVFAQASYSEYCVYHQGCTVGRNGDDRPILETGVILFPNSAVIGRCTVRENTVISAGVHLINQDTPGNCIAFLGDRGKIFFKEIDEYYADRYFAGRK
jgi:serine O-acetyltransferase